MSIYKLNPRPVVSIFQSSSIPDAVKLMKQNNIGDVIVLDESSNRPIGILTDRDIMMKVIGNGVAPEALSVDDIMSRDLLVLKKYQGINECIEMMSAKGVRRAPIVDDDGKLCGIASTDDLLILLADELHSLAKLFRKQTTH